MKMAWTRGHDPGKSWCEAPLHNGVHVYAVWILSIVDETGQLEPEIVSMCNGCMDRIAADLGTTAEKGAKVLPMKGIPLEVACPFCGGYVRGHQWIGTESCSVNHVFVEVKTGE